LYNELQECSSVKDLTLSQLEFLVEYKKNKDWHKRQAHVVSLGDLGRKDIRHEPGDAGTTKSFQLAKEYLDAFQLPYNLVTGNHDLEGLDEFDTDVDNLQAWMKCFGSNTPQFYKRIHNSNTILVGLSTTRFRDAPFSSHEVHINDAQLTWFQNEVLDKHPNDNILVFTHAPPAGSGLRVLQNVHIKNGCAWLNHASDPDRRNAFVRWVKKHPQIKLWCSGHFHLSHDCPASISRVNQCVFLQVGVMGPKSTRDETRQSRFIRGNSKGLEIYTIQHHQRVVDNNNNNNNNNSSKATIRLDATVDFESGVTDLVVKEDTAANRTDWFQAYIPEEEDGCYLETPNGQIATTDNIETKVCWWHMADGAVLGLHAGQLVEYDAETLSPLGVVVPKEILGNRNVLVVKEGRAVVLVDDSHNVQVVHPNDDGSYWRKYQRNKKVRQEEKAREKLAKDWITQYKN